MPDALDSSTSLWTGATAGLVSWLILNRWTIRGDHALGLYSISFVLLYLCLRTRVTSQDDASPRPSPLFLATVLSVVYSLSLGCCTLAYRLSPWHPLASYPGPLICKTSSLWLTCISFTGRRHLVLDRLHVRYGPFVRIGPNVLSVNTTSILSAYQFMEKSAAYRRPARIKVVTLFFKNATETLHRERKRIWSSLFTTTGQSELLIPLERRILELLQCLERRQSESSDGYVDIDTAIAHWSYDFMGDMIFGGCNNLNLMRDGDPYAYVTTGKKAMILLDSAGQTPWLMEILWHIPTSKNIRRLIENAREMTKARLAASSHNLPEFHDLFSYLIEAGISQLDLERDALVAIQAGSDNTSVKTTLALFFLLSEPTYYCRLQRELDKTFPIPVGALSAVELAALPFLNAVINETLRLGSPYFLPRVVPKDGMAIDGRFIPEGTIVAHASYSQQTSANNFFPVPMDFRPERWLPEGLGPDTKTNRSALASFSFGPHACIAKSFAYQEMRFVLARLLLTYNMRLPEGFDVRGYQDGLLNMRATILTRKLLVRVERRPGVEIVNDL